MDGIASDCPLRSGDESLFPSAAPRVAGLLDVGQGHYLHVEEYGSATGIPLVFLHGGPGSGCSPKQHRLVDPRYFRAVFYDQRGCGRSRPTGELAANSTTDLIADLELLRQALDIERWIVFGGSWGSLLGLAYAQAHPEAVLGLMLRGIFLGSRDEITAYVLGGSQAETTAWQRFAGFIPRSERGDLLAAYGQRILSPEMAFALPAVRAWLDYERALMGDLPLDKGPTPLQVAKARIQMHYLSRDCFLAPGQLLAGLAVLRAVPAAIVQGGADPVCPPVSALRLHAAWPEAEFTLVEGGGHGAMAAPISGACIGALERLRQRI